MKAPAVLVAAVLAALAFGASYALSADNGPAKKAAFAQPGVSAKPLAVSEASQLRTGGINASAQAIPTLSSLPLAKPKAAAAPAPVPAPAPRRRARRRATPAPTPAPAPVIRTPAPAPAPAPSPKPKPAPQPTFDDSG